MTNTSISKEQVEQKTNEMLQKHPELEPISKQVGELIDRTYNLAITHAIGVTTKFLQGAPGAELLIEAIEALKKPTV
jgi:hypothetical protein